MGRSLKILNDCSWTEKRKREARNVRESGIACSLRTEYREKRQQIRLSDQNKERDH